MDTPWLEIFKMLILMTVAVLFEPLFWGILGIVAYQYWQMQKHQLAMFGVAGVPLGRQVMWAMIYGTVGGLMGSLVLTLVGVNIERMGFQYIWPLAIMLALINIRFLCFAYAGGLVAICNAIFGWPDVDVPQVLALVAALHVTESVLIAISGRYGAVPVILKLGDRLVGAFNLQNFWPLPLVVLSTVAMQTGALPEGVFHTPDWWPLLPLSIEPPVGSEWVYVMMPVVAALGYTDMAISSTPEGRRRRSALSLALYSLSLLGMALLSAKFAWLRLPAALLSPLGHEYLVRRDNRTEMAGAARYVPPERGVMVLESIDGGIARGMGVRTGDIILEISERLINRGGDLAYAIDWAPPLFELHLLRDGRELKLDGRFPPGPRMLGIILVPEGHESYYVTMSNGSGGPLARIFQRVIRFIRREK
ncbi:MAG TPA: PDZ domain-containing protein [Negativicutes bacterium]|nr:PDZ domain-containing protein [Negativicutes bacterium]